MNRSITGIAAAVLTLCLATSPAGAQDPDPKEEPEKQEEATEQPEVRPQEKIVTVTATRSRKEEFETPRAVTIVDSKRLAERNSLSVLDSLNDQIGVWVEKRTTTTSDPVIRGVSGGNVLALVDGNTLSSFWGEGGFAGDDMYGKVDAESIERIEVVRGPASVLYGSNAVGGVINFITRSPVDYPEKGVAYALRSKAAYGSAAGEIRLREEASVAVPFARVLVGGSYRSVDNADGGRGIGEMDPTGGRDRNWDAKAQVRLGEDSELTLTAQDVHRDPVYRFYRPSQDNINDREAAALILNSNDLFDLFDELEFRVYYQHKKDQRNWYTDATRSVKDKHGVAKWDTLSAGLQTVNDLMEGHRLTVGLAFQRDDGESPDDEQFTVTYFTGPLAGEKRKDAPDSIWKGLAAYLQYEADLLPELTLTGSVRYDYFNFRSNVDRHYVPPGTWDPNQDQIDETEREFSGGVAVLYRPMEDVRLSLGWSRGFRFWPPRFGATQHGWGVVVPTGILPPVTADTVEAGLKFQVPKVVDGSAFIYYTRFDHHQVIVPGTFNGQDWFDFNGNGSQDPNESVFVTRGTGEAWLYGVELEAKLRPHALLRDVGEGWSVRAGFSWNIGKDEETNDPIRHTAPARLLVGLRWEDAESDLRPYVEAYAEAVRRYDRIPDDRLANDVGYRDDPQDGASPLYRDYGIPGYTLYGARGGLRLTSSLDLTLSIENISNKRYRSAHSRMHGIGTNVLIGLEFRL